MPNFTVTMPDGRTYKIANVNSHEDAEAAAAQQQQAENEKNVQAFQGSSKASQVGQTLADDANMMLHGATLGLVNQGAAGVKTGVDWANNLPGVKWLNDKLGYSVEPPTTYQHNLNQERTAQAAAKARLNSQNPYYAAEMEGLGTAATLPLSPASRLVSAVESPGIAATRIAAPIKALLYGGEGAATGAASAIGHNQDPTTGALVGGGFGVAAPLVGAAWRAATPYMPKLGGYVGGASGAGIGGGIGSWIGSHTGLGSWPGYAGMTSGSTIGAGIGSQTGDLMRRGMQGATDWANTPNGRDLLARMTVVPGRYFGQVSEQ